MSNNKPIDCQLMSNPSTVVEERRKMLRGVAVSAVTMLGGGALLTASNSAKAAGVNSIYTVGEGGDYTTLEQAVSVISGSSSTQQYQLVLLPGLHTVSAKVVIPDYVHIKGSESPRDFRRVFSLSHAAIADPSICS